MDDLMGDRMVMGKLVHVVHVADVVERGETHREGEIQREGERVIQQP